MTGKAWLEDAVASPRSSAGRRPLARPRASAAAVVYGATAAYALVFAGAAAIRHLTFGSARFDLGNMTQAVWSTSRGRFLEMTSISGEQIPRLGAHVDPFLALFAPLWLVLPSPLVLLVAQAAAVASGALPVFWLARRRLGSDRAAAFFAFAYLAYTAVQWNAFTPVSSFHPASFVLPLVLFAVWFLDTDRLPLFAVAALLAASTKEHMPAAVGLLGVWYAIEHRRRLAGAAIAVAGTALALLNFLVVIPAFSVEGAHPLSDRYSRFGSTPLEILEGVARNPLDALAAATTGHKLLYLFLLFAPWLGLWLVAPLLLLGALPALAIDLLSSDPNQTSIAYHYSAGIAPFVVAASVVGAGRLPWRRERVAFYALAGVACTAAFSPLLYSAGDARRLVSPDAALQARRAAVAVVPADAAVSATNGLGGHLSERGRILVFPVVADAEWVVLDRSDDDYVDGPNGQQRLRAAFARVERDPRFKIVLDRPPVLVLRRIGRTG